MEIYNVEVCNFNAVGSKGYIDCLVKNEESRHLCLVDFKNNTAIDLATREVFYILGEARKRKIELGQMVELDIDKKYVTSMTPVKIDEMTKKERLKLKSAILKAKYILKDKEKARQR